MRILVIFVSSFILSACNQAPALNNFSDYLSRIANVQDVDPLPAPAEKIQRLPDKRDISISIEPLTIGLLDSYELRKCELFNLIAQRNSVLGKVQDKFRRFDYEVRLLHGLTRCIVNPDISDRLQQQLAAIEASKQRDLPAHWYNLLYSSDAMRAQLSSHRWLDRGWNVTQVMGALQAMDDIQNALHNRPAAMTLPELTPFQEVLEKQPLLGDLKYSLDNATLWLNTIYRQLEQHDEKILCGRNINQTKLTYLRNVFQSSYVEKIQPYLAWLDSLYLQLAPYLTPFEQQSSHQYHFPLADSHEAFRRATRQHMQYWQTLFTRCSVEVGRSGSQ